MSIPPELQDQISQAMRRPEGTAVFGYFSPEAFRVGGSGGILLEVPAGGHYFKLETTSDRHLNFFHSSPANGTRLASIDLTGLPSFERASLVLVWSPQEIRLHCRPMDIAANVLSAVGLNSPVSIRMTADGSLFQFGGEGARVIVTRVYQGEDVLLAPTARDVWSSTLEAVAMLWTGKSDEGFLFEVLQATTTLSMLVTGLESYGKARLLEVESEGIPADPVALFQAFCSKVERDSDRISELRAEASDTSVSLLATVVENVRINFQDFDHLKRAFRAAYGIRIGDTGLKPHEIDAVRRFIQFRHRVVHVSPLMTMLNIGSVPPEEPIFANRALADQAVQAFSGLVNAFHVATTALRPPRESVAPPPSGFN